MVIFIILTERRHVHSRRLTLLAMVVHPRVVTMIDYECYIPARVVDPDPDPGYAVLVEKVGHFLEKFGYFRKKSHFFQVGQVLVVGKKSKEMHCFEVLDVLF